MKKRIQPRFFWPGVFLLSISATYLIYLNFIQNKLMSRRELIPTLLWLILMAGLVFLFLNRFLLPSINKASPKSIRKLIYISVLVGLAAVMVAGRPPANIRLMPKEKLVITAIGKANPLSSGARVVLNGFDTRVGNVSYSTFTLTGEWQRVENTLIHNSPEPAEIHWSGRTSNRAVLYFQTGPDGGEVNISWNGEEQILDLYSPEPSDTSLLQKFQIPLGNYIPAYISIFLISSFLFFSATHSLLSTKSKQPPMVQEPKFAWLLFAIPMIAVWVLYLLVFWPGMMSPDSMTQWGQVVSGIFDDSHPVAHTLLLWLITRIWFSPAAVAIFQILFLSLVTAGGIGILRSMGMPRWTAWLLATLFALSPINGSMVITLWKDIPYSTALFLFSILFLRIVNSNGTWLAEKFNWIWLALTGLMIALFRHNGFPVPVGTLIVLAIIFRGWWKPLLASLLLLLVFWAGIRGPLYDQLEVKKNTGENQAIFLHHIAAYVVQSVKLDSSTSQFVEKILPLNKWKYDCCSIRTTYQIDDFSWEKIRTYDSQLRNLLFKLILSDPKIEINHLVCSSSLVWEVNFRCGLAGIPPFNPNSWIVENPYGVDEASYYPDLAPDLGRMLITIRDNSKYRLIWSPALFFYLGLFCTGILSIRQQSLKTMIIMLPAIMQSGVLILANISADQFRYQYGIYLLGLLTLGFLWIMPNNSKPPTTRKMK